MNVVLIVISTLVGGVFSISQNKIDLNFIVIGIVGIIIILFLLYSAYRLKRLNSEQIKLFDKLRRDKWK